MLIFERTHLRHLCHEVNLHCEIDEIKGDYKTITVRIKRKISHPIDSGQFASICSSLPPPPLPFPYQCRSLHLAQCLDRLPVSFESHNTSYSRHVPKYNVYNVTPGETGKS
jgi:hypothetical protein